MTSIKDRLRLAKVNRRFNIRARAILLGLKDELSWQDRALCNDYAADMLGSRAYAPGLYIYCVIAGEFRDGWIPDNYYSHYVVKRVPYRGMSGKRALGPLLFGAENFPDIAYRIENRFVTRNGAVVSAEDLPKVLFETSDRVIFKMDSSSRGTGVRFFNKDAFDTANLHKVGNGVFQNVVRQHRVFDQISANALATLRLTTVLDRRGVPTLRGSCVNLGRHADRHVRAASAIRVPFDHVTGRLSADGYLPDWNRVMRHPDTGTTFAGFQIPNIAACTALVTRTHSRFPFVECIGWDLAVDQAGEVHILEWNAGHTGITLAEATQGPHFRDLDWSERWRRD